MDARWKRLRIPKPPLGLLLFSLGGVGACVTYACSLGIELGMFCVTVAFFGMFAHSVNRNLLKG